MKISKLQLKKIIQEEIALLGERDNRLVEVIDMELLRKQGASRRKRIDHWKEPSKWDPPTPEGVRDWDCTQLIRYSQYLQEPATQETKGPDVVAAEMKTIKDGIRSHGCAAQSRAQEDHYKSIKPPPMSDKERDKRARRSGQVWPDDPYLTPSGRNMGFAEGKITRTQIRQVVLEEAENVLKEYMTKEQAAALRAKYAPPSYHPHARRKYDRQQAKYSSRGYGGSKLSAGLHDTEEMIQARQDLKWAQEGMADLELPLLNLQRICQNKGTRCEDYESARKNYEIYQNKADSAKAVLGQSVDPRNVGVQRYHSGNR